MTIGRGWILNTEANLFSFAFVAHLLVRVCDMNYVPSVENVVVVVNVETVA